MKRKKQRFAFGIFQDGLSIKLAQLGAIDSKVRILHLKEIVLSHPLYIEEKAEEIEKIEDLEEGLKIPEISEYDETEKIEKVEGPPEDLTGKTELQKLLLDFPLDKGKIALSAIEEQVSYYQFEPTFAASKIRKKIQSEIFSKEELKAKNYTFDYIINSDKSILALVHRGESELLKALQEINFIISKQRFFYSFIDTNEISLMNLVRCNYDIPTDEYTLILYIGVDYKEGIVIKGKDYFKAFPIILTDTKNKDVRESVYSKVILEQDVSNIPMPHYIFLAGDNISDKEMTFFQEKYPDAAVEILGIKNVGIDESQAEEFTKEKIGEFAIPIALAWKALDSKNKCFFPTNLLPSKIIESQKHFKIAWHGLLVLAAIFYFSLIGTIKHQDLNQKIIEARTWDYNIEMELRKTKNTVAKLNQVKNQISTLQQNVENSVRIIGNKNQWHYILNMLSNFLSENKISWITRLDSRENNFEISGYTTQRRNIIGFSKLFPNGRIIGVTSYLIQEVPIWKFDMVFSYPNPEDIKKEEERLPEIHITSEVPHPKAVQPLSQATDRGVTEKLPQQVMEKPTAVGSNIETSEESIRTSYENIIKIYFSGNVEKAYEKFSEFIKMYPNHRLVYNATYFIGECLYLMGRISEAKAIFERTLTLGGTKAPDALMMLGNSYKKENNIEKANHYWNQLVNNFPNNRLAKIAEKKIKENM
jgi:TolA-binding protein